MPFSRQMRSKSTWPLPAGAGGEHLAVVGEDLVGDAVAAQGQSQSFAHRTGGGPGDQERETQKRKWSSRPVMILRSPPVATFTPPMMSICQSSMERLLSHRR